jgi:hypothetical protein
MTANATDATDGSAVCAECGSPFDRPRRRGRPKLTCSPRCRALRTAALAERRAADACPTCGAARRHWSKTCESEDDEPWAADLERGNCETRRPT